MRAVCIAILAAGSSLGAAACAAAQDGFGFGHPGYAPNLHYGLHAPSYYPPTHYPPVYGRPPHFGGWGTGWGGWDYPGHISGVSYTYSYYTHVPGYSFDYHRGHMPRYAPGPWGGYGPYGYGPYGW